MISDRFADSTRIYQGVLGNVDARLIARLEKLTVGELGPDLTIILDICRRRWGLRASRERRGDAPVDRFEGEAFEFHKKLREAYLELAEREPNRCVVINASADAATVAEFVWAAVNARLHPAAPLMIQDAS